MIEIDVVYIWSYALVKLLLFPMIFLIPFHAFRRLIT